LFSVDASGPRLLKKLCRPPGRGGPLKLGLTQETISIPAIWTKGDGESIEPSADLIHFLRTQLARTLPNQHSILVIHCFCSFSSFFGPLRPQAFKAILPGRRGKAAR
jgi:hypothetical protein